jgi:hypothetical protein
MKTYMKSGFQLRLVALALSAFMVEAMHLFE